MHVLVAAGLGLGHGHHHGGRIIGLILLIVLVGVIAYLLVRRGRRHNSGSGTPPDGQVPQAPGPRSEAPAPARAPRTQPQRTRPQQTTEQDHTVTGSHRRFRVDAGSARNRIEARSLSKRYGAKLAVDDLTFSVEPGHVTGFLGPNGAGKSTTMRMVMGLDAPTSGSVTVSGRRYHDLEWPLREVGGLLEACSVHPGRRADAHLLMLARANRIARARVEEVLDLVGLTSVADQRVGQFSLGMGQRLGIAVALLGDPGIVLLDEPMNGLDTDGIRWVRRLLRALAAEGRSVFVSSHLMSEMAHTVDQLVVIGKGRLIAQMPVSDFTATYAHRSTRVRSPHLDRLLPALRAAGATTVTEPDGAVLVQGLEEERIGEVAWRESVLLYELAPQSASLEDAFIESTEGDVEFTRS